MNGKIFEIKNSKDPSRDLSLLLEKLHLDGPVNSSILEDVSLYKEFHPYEFSLVEEQIISAMGLFYKIKNPESLYSLIMATVGNYHATQYGAALTPVQANVRKALDENQFVSISAPTSAGKSYSVRDFIAKQTGDAVVVVPSRALIAEYISSIKEIFIGSKNVMISSFVDSVFKKRDLRHIFILTPERARELFTNPHQLNISLFFFDEAKFPRKKAEELFLTCLFVEYNESSQRRK